MKSSEHVANISSAAAEDRLWHFLPDGALDGFTFRRRYSIGSYVAPLVCLERQLVIHIEAEESAAVAPGDVLREVMIKALGFRVLRVRASEVNQRLPSVISRIRAVLNMRTEIGEGHSPAHSTASLPEHPVASVPVLPLRKRNFFAVHFERWAAARTPGA